MKRTILLLVLIFGCNLSAFCQMWVQKKDYAPVDGADGAALFYIGNKVYIAGGFDSKKFYEYDIATDTWTDKGNLPGVTYCRAFATGFAINGKGYIGLGLDINTATSGAYCKNDLWEYDPSSGQWAQKAPYPGNGCDGHFSFVINNIAYVGGGEPINGPSKRDMYAYDPVANKWTKKNDFPEQDGVVSPFTFSMNDKGYVSCGMQTDGNSQIELKKTYQYDPVSDNWSPKADFIGISRQGGVSFVINNKAYCGWGFTHLGPFYNDFFEYNDVANTWNSSFTSPAVGRAFASAIKGNSNKIYLGTGSRNVNLYDWWELEFFPTGIADELHEQGQNIYPNPSSGQFYLASVVEDGMYEICMLSGQCVQRGNLKHSNSINADRLTKGMYLLRITDGNNIFRKLVEKLD